MSPKHYRTNVTELTDDELSLLDVMFDGGVAISMLRQCNIGLQFNVRPHSLDDESLKQSLKRFHQQGIVEPLEFRHRNRRYITLTSHGVSLWESERCPNWERYCTDRECATVRDKTIMSVRAVSPDIRDDYLRIAVEKPIRLKKTTINDNGLIKWKYFDRLHVGLASCYEPNDVSVDNYHVWIQERRNYIMMVERERTWWRTAWELQKFTSTAENAG